MGARIPRDLMLFLHILTVHTVYRPRYGADCILTVNHRQLSALKTFLTPVALSKNARTR